jgi:hypothetical protein
MPGFSVWWAVLTNITCRFPQSSDSTLTFTVILPLDAVWPKLSINVFT